MPWQSGRVAMPLDRSRDSRLPLFFILGRGSSSASTFLTRTSIIFIVPNASPSRIRIHASFSTYHDAEIYAQELVPASFAEKRGTV